MDYGRSGYYNRTAMLTVKAPQALFKNNAIGFLVLAGKSILSRKSREFP